jgi:alpha-L-rhamnosidase
LLAIPWHLYQFTGDTAILTRYYPAMKAYVDYLTDHSQGHLLAFGIDDHKQIPQITQGDILSSGYYFYLSGLLGDMAAILGKGQDAAAYNSLAGQIKKAFNDKYFDQATGIYGVGGQTQLSKALYFGLVEAGEKQRVLDNLLQAIRARDGHIETGVLGTKFLVNTLLEQGQDRVLYEMAAKTDFPGWGYWVKQGATTLYQNWDTSQSLNHIMFGTIGDYFYKGLVGLNVSPSAPGFKHFVIRPSLANDLTWAKGNHRSPYGLISSFWEKEGDNLVLEVTVPANTTADIYLPGANVATVRENGKRLRRAKGVTSVEQEQEAVRVRVGSGSYRFSFTRKG